MEVQSKLCLAKGRLVQSAQLLLGGCVAAVALFPLLFPIQDSLVAVLGRTHHPRRLQEGLPWAESKYIASVGMCPEGFQPISDSMGCDEACIELREVVCSYDMGRCVLSAGNGSIVRSVCAPSRHLKVICRFLSTLVNEGILNGDVFTREELLNVTIVAGIESEVASAHVSLNFKNEPSGVMNIFNMDGGTNEHDRSVGIHDCISVYSNCTINVAGIQSCRNSTEQCTLPARPRFEDFWMHVDINGDGWLSHEELAIAAPRLPFNDANPIGEGTSEESHGFILSVFGTEDKIDKSTLERVFLGRRFPHGYRYRRGVSLMRNVVSQANRVVALASSSKITAPYGLALGLTPRMKSSRCFAPTMVGRIS